MNKIMVEKGDQMKLLLFFKMSLSHMVYVLGIALMYLYIY